MSKPLYYRFVYDPQTGESELHHNDEEHPANIKYHSELSKPDAYHGYAYRIGKGWRVTDWEHNPLDDPYVNASVLKSIRKEEGTYHPHPELDWHEIEQEPQVGDRYHYGLPLG